MILLLCLALLVFLASVYLVQIVGRNIILDYSPTLKESLSLPTETNQEKNLQIPWQENYLLQLYKCQMEKTLIVHTLNTGLIILGREQDYDE